MEKRKEEEKEKEVNIKEKIEDAFQKTQKKERRLYWEAEAHEGVGLEKLQAEAAPAARTRLQEEAICSEYTDSLVFNDDSLWILQWDPNRYKDLWFVQMMGLSCP